jgi:hypothetical protein
MAKKKLKAENIIVSLLRAEAECLAEAEVRDLRREKEAERRAHQDAAYIAEFAQKIAARYPVCPTQIVSTLAEHPCKKYSVRVGRSAVTKEFDPEAMDLAVVAHVRHTQTNYDELLAKGWERSQARATIASDIQTVLSLWGKQEKG